MTSLERAFSAVVSPPSPVPPDVGVGEREIVAQHERALRVVGYDGAVLALELSATDGLVEADGGHFRVSLERGVDRLSPSGVEPVVRRRPGHDLAGAKLPEGAFVDRTKQSGDEGPRIAVVERLRLPGCRVEDRLHVVDVKSGSVTTIASDERLRLHPRFARGRLHVVEADAVYEVVAGM